MVLKKITVYFQIAQEALASLRATYPTIILEAYKDGNKTTFIVDITAQQETQVIPVLKDHLVKIETIV